MEYNLLGNSFFKGQKILVSTKENESVEYVSSIDFLDSQVLSITMPLLDQMQMPLAPQQEIFIKADTDKSVVGFNSKVISFSYSNIILVNLTIPAEFEKIERRKSFRIEVMLKTQIALLSSSAYNEPVFRDATAFDISNSGIQLISPTHYSLNDLLLVRFQLEIDKEPPVQITVKSKVIRSVEDYPSYKLGTSFINISDMDVRRITRYIFKKLIANFTTLDNVISQTLSAIENGKKQVFDISEDSRWEYQRLKKELEETRSEVEKLLVQVDQLAIDEKKSRIRLATVSKDFKTYTEKDIKESYDQAQEKQILLTQLRGQENLARFKRDSLERSLRRMSGMIEKADLLASQFSVITNYLAGNIMDMSRTIGEMKQSQQLGISILKAQEEERKRLSRDIHDGPAQLMANIVMRAEFCLKLMDIDQNRVRGELHEMQDMARKCLHEVRKIIFDLRPMLLDDLGLIPAIKRYIEEFQSGCDTKIELLLIGESRRLPSAIEVSLFRVIQESLNNIRKHAQAQNAMIKVELTHSRTSVVIKDDGVGFNFDETINNREKEDFGLLGMKERIQILDGNISFNTGPGIGTLINISLKHQE
jgi:two-component system sensor histidine kinase DegS